MANKTISPGFLNTVSLSYRPSRLLSTEEERLLLARSGPHPRQVPPNPQPKQANQDLFSDLRMKGGRSNTLQQSNFARLKLKVYRRTKRDPLLSPSPPSQEPAPPPRLNKTSFRCRVHREPIRFPTQSSTSDPESSTPFETPTSELANVQLKQQKMRIAAKVMVQPPPSLKNIKIRQIPMRSLAGDEKKAEILGEKVDKKVAKREKDLFEAWESYDIFGSNKGGIVEYTQTIVQPKKQQEVERGKRRILVHLIQ